MWNLLLSASHDRNCKRRTSHPIRWGSGAADGGPDGLRVLIEEEVARWSEDHKRGLRPFDLADPATVAEDQPGNSSKRDGLSGSTRPC